MSERDLTSEEIEALEELADLSERDPVLYEQIIREGLAEAEQQEQDALERKHGEELLQMLTAGNQERNNEFIKLLNEGLRQQQAEEESNQP